MDRTRGIRVRGNSIVIDFMYEGTRCRETLAMPPTKPNLKYALGLRETVLHEIACQTFIYAKRFPNSKNIKKFSNSSSLIKDDLINYLNAKKKSCAHSTWRDYDSAIHHHLIPEFGDLSITEVKTSHIREWINNLSSISNKRINNVLIPLRAIFENAYLDEIIDRNPLERIKNLPVKQDEPQPFNTDEIKRILNALPDQSRNLFKFAFWTGLRTSELIALEWQDIDFEKGTIQVRRASVRKHIKETKTVNGNRDVKMLDDAREALNDQLQYSQEGQIFLNPNTGKPWITDGQIRKTSWIPALEAAGVDYRNPYQTRHTYASMLLSAGENPMWVASQMGHADWGMIRKRYGRWIPSNEHDAGAKISAFVTTLSQGALSD